MVKKGDKVSDKTKRQMSEAAIKRSQNPEYRRHQSEAQKEHFKLYPVSDEKKQKIREARLGTHASEETKRKMSDQRKGRIAWNKGKTHSPETKAKISVANRGRQPMLGKHHSEESKAKVSRSLLGNQRRKGIPHTEETKRWVSLEHKSNPKIFAALSKGHKLITKISKPQRELFFLMKQIFPDAELEYQVKTKSSCRFIDIAIPSIMIAVEYDGTYWHQDKEEEIKRDVELAEIGWTTLHVHPECLKIISNKMLPSIVNNFAGRSYS